MAVKTCFQFGIRIFILCLLVSKGNSEFDEQSVEDEEQHDDECRILDPIPQRTSVTGENEIHLIDFLHNGTTELEVPEQDSPEDVILVLGNTGSGKTTLTQMIAGDLTKLHAVLTDSGRLVIIDDMEKIGAPSTTSRTIIPELVISTDKNLTYYDCPGFDDTRGPVKDLAANYFMNRVIQGVSRVKLLFLVTHSSVQLGNDRLDFDLLAHHATTFVKNLHNFETSIGLVVTKVNGFSNRNGKVLTDKQILKSIIEFLRVYKNDIQSSLPGEKDESKRDSTLKKIQFVDILLTKEKERYARLTFSKNPDSCGPLSESPIVTATKNRVLKVIQKLEFSPVGSANSNFGFTLKDSTVLKVLQNYTKELNDAITLEIGHVINNVTKWYGLEYSRDTTDLPMIGHRLLNIWDNVNTIDTSETFYPSNIATELSMWLNSIGFEYNGELEDIMEEKQSYFEFFDTVTRQQVERKYSDWIAPITYLQRLINQDKEDYKVSILSRWVKWGNDKVRLTVQTEVNSVKEWLDKIMKIEKVNLPLISSGTWNILRLSESLDKNYSHDAEVFGTEVRQVFSGLGYNLLVSFLGEMSRSEQMFKMFEDFLNSTIEREVDTWKLPIMSLKRDMEKYKTEYTTNVKSLYVRQSNTRLQSCFISLKNGFSHYFSEKKEESRRNNSPRVSSTIINMWKHSTELEQIRAEDPHDVLSNTASVLSEMGYNVTNPVISCVNNENKHLQFFEKILGQRVERSVNFWMMPIHEIKVEIDTYQSDYLALVENKLVTEVNTEIASILNRTLGSFQSWAETNLIRTYDNVNGIHAVLANIDRIIGNLTVVESNFDQNFINEVFETFTKLKYSYSPALKKQDTSSIKYQFESLEFFDRITGSVVKRNIEQWKEPLVNLIAGFGKVKQNSMKRADQFIGQAKDNVASKVSQEMNLFIEFFERKLNSMNISTVVNTTQNAYMQITRIQNNSNLTQFSENIQSGLQPLGYVLSRGFTSFMNDQERFYNNLETVSNLTVDRLYAKWFDPVRTCKEDVYKMKIWYEFCERIRSELGGYGFQNRKTDASVLANLTWIDFLEKNVYFAVSEEIKQIGLKYKAENKFHFKTLQNIFEDSLSTEEIKCEEDGSTITVTGKYIRLRKILNEGGSLERDTCGNVKRLEVYASEKIFIDTSIRATGRELRVLFVAPVWEVVGSTHIDLNGAEGEDQKPLKANNGTELGDRGSNGKRGKPGGPGGSFLGISNKIINPAGLTVSTNGGKGGRGQTGGNGREGQNGSIQDFDVNDLNLLIVIIGRKGKHGAQGGDGGDGGSGGKGGLGGKAGKVELISPDKEGVQVESHDGEIGEDGMGGYGALGGRGSVEQNCGKLRLAGISIPRECTLDIHSDGSEGTDGRRGGSVEGTVLPKTPKPSYNIEEAKTKFVDLYGRNATTERLFNH